MSGPLLDIRGVSKSFGGFAALTTVDLHVSPGERMGLIGPNGSGKTTLINCVSGLLRPDKGEIHFEGHNVTPHSAFQRARAGISRSFQIPKPFASMSVLENLCVPLRYAAGRRGGMAQIEQEAQETLALFGLGDKAAVRPSELTQIEMRKLELSRALAGDPKLLILDEVMAGLSNSEVDEILAILRQLNDRGITVIMIEHIMRAVMSFSQRLIVLDAGEKIAEGDPEAIMRNKDVERAYLGE